jgi:hypothetical protein
MLCLHCSMSWLPHSCSHALCLAGLSVRLTCALCTHGPSAVTYYKRMCIITSLIGLLDSLKIISHLAELPEMVLSTLEAIPSTLSSISKLVLHAVSSSITNVRTSPTTRPLSYLIPSSQHSGHPRGTATYPFAIYQPEISHTLFQE